MEHLKIILWEYVNKVENFKSVQSTYNHNLVLLKKKKKHHLLVLQKLRKQLLFLTTLQQSSSQRSLWKLTRESVFWEPTCKRNNDEFFKSHFRMTRDSFDILCSYLGSMKKKETNWRTALSLPKRVAIAVFALVSAAEYRVIAELFGVGKATVCTILLEFCKDVWKAMSKQYIKKLPPTEETVTESVNGFHRLGFQKCLGAIDGCHNKVRPKLEDLTDYYNYKGWYSIFLLAIVDYRYRFLYINVGAPGRCNDSQIFNTSRIKQTLKESEILGEHKKEINGVQVPIFIMGDSAFRFSPTLMKPYAFCLDLTEEQNLFNYRLSKCRRVVENAFGHLKARFRRIGKGIDNRIGNAGIIVAACCTLYNFFNINNDKINQNWMMELEALETNRNHSSDTVIIDDNEPSAGNIRQAISNYLSSALQWMTVDLMALV